VGCLCVCVWGGGSRPVYEAEVVGARALCMCWQWQGCAVWVLVDCGGVECGKGWQHGSSVCFAGVGGSGQELWGGRSLCVQLQVFTM
jgi:hypothetical protein